MLVAGLTTFLFSIAFSETMKTKNKAGGGRGRRAEEELGREVICQTQSSEGKAMKVRMCSLFTLSRRSPCKVLYGTPQSPRTAAQVLTQKR